MYKFPELENLVLYPCISSVLVKKEQMLDGANLLEISCIKVETVSK